MEDDDFLELQREQRELVDEFINSGNMNIFKKVMNARTKPKKKKPFYMSEGYIKPSEILRRYHSQRKKQMRDFEAEAIKPTFTQEYTSDGSYKLNRYNFLESLDENKDKKMKGNYKWGVQKFNQMKINWAKRKGIPIEQFQVPKKESYRGKRDAKTVSLSASCQLPLI